MVVLAHALMLRKFHDEVHQIPVQEVQLLLHLLETLLLHKVECAYGIDRTVEVLDGEGCHAEYLLLGLLDSHRRGLEHVVIHIMQARCIRVQSLRLVRNHLHHHVHQQVGQREYAHHGDHIEEGMEHCELGLRRSREPAVEEMSETEGTA